MYLLSFFCGTGIREMYFFLYIGCVFACDRNLSCHDRVSFNVNPVSDIIYPSWYTRDRPDAVIIDISWRATDEELYTLFIVDAGFLNIHGTWINIVGNKLHTAEVHQILFNMS